jgi:transglutaminase-like putative cysteine protease
MTAAAGTREMTVGLPAEQSWGPSEGWSTVFCLAVMLFAVGLAVDDARWVGLGADGESRTWFLPLVAVLGGAWGLGGAKSRLPTLAVHLIGAVIGSAAVILLVAGAVSTAPDVFERWRALVDSLGVFMADLLVRHIRSSETSAFMLGAGLVAWATGAFAAFAVFRRHRPIDAILLAGLVILTNVSLTYQPELPHLVVFAAASLLLMVRSNLVKQRAGWLRRRVGEAGHVSDLLMRRGLTFVALALSGALVLTTVASSAPLAGAWRGFDRDLVRLGETINRLVGGVDAPARGPNSLFASDQLILDRWISSNEVVFRAAPSDGVGYYWQAAAYDAFDGQAWHQSDRVATRVEAAGAILGPSSEAPSASGRHEITVRITTISAGGDLVVAPAAPMAVDRAVNVWTLGQGGPFAVAELSDGLRDGESYDVLASVRYQSEVDGGLTRAQLAAAGQAYPGWLAPYVGVQPDSDRPLTRALAQSIYAGLPADRRDDFHVADAIQRYLTSTGGFRYAVDLRGLCATDQVVECFLTTKVGFCQYFATAMIMLLRELGIPSRLVMGYLPGQRQTDGSWLVRRSAAHAWVEVYFPGYGWVAFDPTPGNTENGQRPSIFEAGSPLPTSGASPGASFPSGRRTFGPATPSPVGGGGGASGSSDGGSGGALLIALLVMLGAGVLIIGVAIRERRGPLLAPDAVYRGVASLAGWFGYGPRPTQTTYEYASGLGDLVPAARPELQLVALAKVEATYGRRQPGPEGLVALRAAYRRLRFRLLTLALRRRGRGRS